MSTKNNLLKEIFDEAYQHYQNGSLEQAEILFNKVLEITPKHFLSILLLGTISLQNKKFQTAIELLKQAIEINPNYAEAHNNLGNAFQEKGLYHEAIYSYKESIKINPNFSLGHYNLGNVLQKSGQFHDAVSSYKEAIKIDPNNIKIHNNLGNAFQNLNEDEEAMSCYHKVIQIDPNNIKARNNLGYSLKKINKHQEAIKSFQKVIQIDPNNLTAHWLSMNTFPIIYNNFEEVNDYRKKFEEDIKKINQLLNVNINYSKKQIINTLESSTNFYLHYQGREDLNLQIKYAQIIERLTQKIYQEFHKELKIKKPTNFIKIGFISSYFRNHSVCKGHQNWILKLDKNIYKIFVYYADNKYDHITNTIIEYADIFFSHTNVNRLIHQISKDNLDVLIYLDIGMHPKIQILGSLRLAPIQCNTWGHPVTSGLKNIDYFFSSQLMEIKDSQKNYSEKLINLPGIGVDYNHTDITNIKKPNVLNKFNKTLFFNIQSLFKLLPQDDHIYLDILKKYSNCCFWFFQGKSNSITSIFKERISKLFQKEGYSFEEYSYFHPRCSLEEFLGLVEQSDIILDSINWSGCNSSLEAISLNKPIVTLPGALMRGRHTYSFLKILDIEETIASSKEEYVKIAVKLASDKNFKNSVINKIKKNKNRLFNDEKPIRFLEEFFKNKFKT